MTTLARRRSVPRLPLRDPAGAVVLAAGLAVLAWTLLGPLHEASHDRLWTHMVQHLLLTDVVALSLVVGGLVPRLVALAPDLRRRWHRSAPAVALRRRGRGLVLATPVAAAGLYVGVLYLWHLPATYDAAVAHPELHVVEHVMLLGAGLAFWTAVVLAARTAPLLGVLALFLVSVGNGLLAALLTFSPPLYESYLHHDHSQHGHHHAPLAGSSNLSATEDQQLGGLIMWVPGSVVHLGAALLLLALLLQGRQRRWRVAVPTLLLVVVVGVVGCGRSPAVLKGEDFDSERGRELVDDYGCASCHSIPGIRGADGRVGPPLDDFGERRFVAGSLPNDLDNLTRWIQDPQEIEPGTAMPDMAIPEQDARDLAAYLLTLGR